MQTEKPDFPIIDAHIHFMSYKTQKKLIDVWSGGNKALITQDKKRRNLHAKRQNNPPWEYPDLPGDKFALKWLAELDKNNINRAVFLCLMPYADDFKQFIAAGKGRFFGFTSVDPLSAEQVKKLAGYMKENGFCGLKFSPALQHFNVYDERVYPVYELAQARGWPIIFHMGLTLSYFADIRYINPLDLQPVARDFPHLKIIVPHFGAGYLRETLFLAYHCANVYFDSSSSNIWTKYMPYEVTLRQVFEKFLDAVGAKRIIFGTDSSYFPRGYRNRILDKQLDILDKLNLTQEELKNILGGNILRLLGSKDFL